MGLNKQELIRLSKSDISEREIKSVIKVLKKGFLGMGNEVQEFEVRLSNYLGREAICVVNGTAALQLALQACNIGVGDEVLVPSLTYVATYQAIIATGAKPISCDVDREELIIDISDAQNKITNKAKAIIPVFFSGGVGDLRALYSFANNNKLRVIEDAAHAFGSKYKNKLIGSFGDITCFSFDGIKNITSGEGGCIVTSDRVVAKRIKDSRLLGVQKDTENRYLGKRSWEFDVTQIGWRYHMSNIMASIGISQLERLKYFSKKRQELAKKYDQLFKNNDTVFPLKRDYESIIPHIYVVKIKGLVLKKELRDSMLELKIETGSHYQPNHLLSLFIKSGDCPITEEISKELISLPLHTLLSEEQIEYISQSLISVLKKNPHFINA